MQPVSSTLAVAGQRLECRCWGTPGAGPATLVLLHEGLGCVRLWRDFPRRLGAATGLPVFAYSRAGYGGSDPVALPRSARYMHHEGEVVLPALLAAAGIDDAVLIGHSDGASIAIVHAGSDAPRVRALVLIAPHVFNEPRSRESIRRAGMDYRDGDLRARLALYHGANVDVAFRGWHDVWLSPSFRDWSIESYLSGIHVPALVVQGRDDEYGTESQAETVARGVSGPAERLMLDGCGHWPNRERAAETVGAIAAFLGRHLAGAGD